MKNQHFDRVTNLLNQALPRLASTPRLEFKNCFGAVAGYVNGRIFISCGTFGVALRLPPDILDDLFQEKDVQRLRYFPNGHIKREYAVLPDRMVEDKRRVRKLVEQSIDFALS